MTYLSFPSLELVSLHGLSDNISIMTPSLNLCVTDRNLAYTMSSWGGWGDGANFFTYSCSMIKALCLPILPINGGQSINSIYS